MLLDKWFTFLKKAANAKSTLVLFHYAGGNSGIYRALTGLITQPVNILALDLPGRAKRFNEPLIGDLHTAAGGIAQGMLDSKTMLSEHPLMFFGHSIGAKLAFEVSQLLQRNDGLKLRHLIVSGSGAPHIERSMPNMHNLPQQEFIAQLRKYGGTPEALLDDMDLLELLMPMLRSDFKMAELYRSRDSIPVACNLTAFGGDSDETVAIPSLQAWSKHAGAGFETRIFSGGHFFLHQQERSVAQAIDDIILSTVQ